MSRLKKSLERSSFIKVLAIVLPLCKFNNIFIFRPTSIRIKDILTEKIVKTLNLTIY
jgi:hypothetical protein